MNVEAGDRILVPDGYYGDGAPRPWRYAVATTVVGHMVRFGYVGSTEEGVCPVGGAKLCLAGDY